MKMVIILLTFIIGFPKILDSGYEEEIDLYYIAMNKLDEDLSSVVKK
jgi:hypothetical protein